VTSLRIKEASKKMRNIQTRRLGNTGKTLEDFNNIYQPYFFFNLWTMSVVSNIVLKNK
jgi:hypothetical protein